MADMPPRTPSPSPRPARVRGAGSQPALRRRNTERVVEALLQAGPSTQATLVRLTGLSAGTVSNIVKDLGARELITTRPVIDSGRRAIEIALRAHDQVSVGIDVDADGLRVVVARLDHTVLADAVEPLPLAHTPHATLRQARRLLDRELDRAGVARGDVVGAAVGLPTLVGRDGTVLREDPGFPGWHGTDLTAVAETTFPFPVSFSNDANLHALAQVTWGPYTANAGLVAVTLDEGIGAGIIVGGDLVRGALGTAGELGHIVVSPHGEVCRCGNRGCLTTVCTLPRIVADVRRAKHAGHGFDVDRVIELARQRDTVTLRVLQDTGLVLGGVLGQVCSVLNPQVVVLSSPITAAGAPFLDPVTRGLTRSAHPLVAPQTAVTVSRLGARAEALGGAALAARGALVTK